ncbi:XylR family transcriptional regulator [Celerinatantimonas sp. YJH-8]|uniref:XylR family transcriptional regulator n=1 Tax=Celerinatantimonas sp. YJH-8 TaxID=3228714 RepID=UPI0038C16FC4
MNHSRHIRLLFNANKVYDRQVIEGIGQYLNAAQCDWDIFLEEDFRVHWPQLTHWQGDGVIADFDNPKIEELLQSLSLPIVGVGGSYHNPVDYPQYPYIATDNAQLIQCAFHHLKSKGLENFAFYGLPPNPFARWAAERETAFRQLIQQQGFQAHVFQGNHTDSKTWQSDMRNLSAWLHHLPKPVGIIAVTDSRARHLLQGCELMELMVPEQIAIVGIDNEEVARYLTRTSLSSVEQGCLQMGYYAAKLLHQLMDYPDQAAPPPRLIAPVGIHARQSSDFKALRDPLVIQAMHYIRQNACRGIKVEQVLDYVGISRSNLENRFKNENQCSIHQAIHAFKLRQACQLLTTTDLAISQIADDCGYPSLQYLYAVFQKQLHITPKDYRLQATRYHGPTDPSSEPFDPLLSARL